MVIRTLLALSVLLAPASGFSQYNPPDVLWAQKGHGELVRAVRFSSDGTRLASGGGDRYHTYGSVVTYDPATGEVLSEVWRNGDYDLMHVFGLEFVDDHRLLTAEGGREGGGGPWTAFPSRLLDLDTGEAAYVTGVQGSTQCDIDVSPGGTLVAYAQQSDSTVEVKDTSSGTTLFELPIGTDGSGAVEFSPDGTSLAVLGNYGTLRIFRVSDGALLRILENNETVGQAKFFVLGAGDLAWTPDGTRLAVALNGYGCGVKVWDVPSGQVLHRLSLNYYWAGKLDFAPGGLRLFVASSEWDYAHQFGVRGTAYVRVIDTQTGAVTNEFDVPVDNPNDGVLSIDVSPDGSVYAFGTAAGKVTVARVPTTRLPKNGPKSTGR